MQKQNTYKTLVSYLSKVTSLEPEIYFPENSNNILIVWKGSIPNEDTVGKIEEVLKKFGTVLPAHHRNFNLISFTILR